MKKDLNEEELKKLQKIELEMLIEIDRICKKNQIKYTLIGGSLLGAVRHKGFIPWDDDMDLNMPRADYEKLMEVFESELGDRYDLLAPGYKVGANCFLMRIMKKGTTLLNMIDEKSPYPTGIYIDITPIDYAPENKLALQLKGVTADILRLISYSVYWKQYKSDSLEKFMMNSEGKTYYKIRMLIGLIFSFRSAEKWFTTFDKFIRGKKSNHITVAAGREKYRGAYYPVNVFYPPKLVPFEDRQIYIVNKEDTYMSRLYGNYMKIPDLKNREKHLCLKLDFENGQS